MTSIILNCISYIDTKFQSYTEVMYRKNLGRQWWTSIIAVYMLFMTVTTCFTNIYTLMLKSHLQILYNLIIYIKITSYFLVSVFKKYDKYYMKTYQSGIFNQVWIFLSIIIIFKRCINLHWFNILQFKKINDILYTLINISNYYNIVL